MKALYKSISMCAASVVVAVVVGAGGGLLLELLSSSSWLPDVGWTTPSPSILGPVAASASDFNLCTRGGRGTEEWLSLAPAAATVLRELDDTEVQDLFKLTDEDDPLTDIDGGGLLMDVLDPPSDPGLLMEVLDPNTEDEDGGLLMDMVDP